MSDVDFVITIDSFNEGLSPSAHLDAKTFNGNKGQAGEMLADILTNPGYLQQAPALANLTNGSQAGVVDQLIRFILDKPVSASVTYAVGATKLFKLTPTTVSSGGTPSWPQAVTNMTEGESVIQLKDNLFVFYNKTSGGDIAAMPIATEVIDPDWGSATDQALEKAVHPVAVKEDIMVFGNGRYLGVYIEGLATLNVRKLDFGDGAIVSDVVFYNNLWYIAVNYGEGRRSQIFLYDASATSAQLADEVAVGNQEIGFLFVSNGILYVAYQDTTTGYFAIAWLNGRQLKPLRYFSGTLPNHRQKCLYMNTILLVSDEQLLSFGAVVEQLPLQISSVTNGGYATVGGLAAPFGVPIVASTDGATNFRIAKFSGLSKSGYWKSISIDVTKERNIGNISTVIVITKPLEANAQAEVTIEGNLGSKTSNTLVVTGTGKTRHVFRTINLLSVEDIRCVVSHANSDTTANSPIRKIIILGNFVEK